MNIGRRVTDTFFEGVGFLLYKSCLFQKRVFFYYNVRLFVTWVVERSQKRGWERKLVRTCVLCSVTTTLGPSRSFPKPAILSKPIKCFGPAFIKAVQGLVAEVSLDVLNVKGTLDRHHAHHKWTQSDRGAEYRVDEQTQVRNRHE